MFQELFHFVLINGVRVASAILPAAPLLGQKLPPVFEDVNLTHRAFDERRTCAPIRLGKWRSNSRLRT